MNVKRFSILTGALCAAALFALYCADVDFDNPLDEKGDNFLYGDTTRRDDKIRPCEGSTCEGNLAGLFSDPALQCDGAEPNIDLVGSNFVTLQWDPNGSYRVGYNEFERLYNVEVNGINGVVTANGGPRGTQVIVTTTLRDGNGNTLDTWIGHPNIPQYENQSFVIVYTATKQSNCIDETPNPTAEVHRTIHVSQYVTADTLPAVVIIQGPNPYELSVGGQYTEFGATATAGTGSNARPIPVDDTVYTDRNTGTRLQSIPTDVIGEYLATYRACKPLIYSDGRPAGQSCDSKSRQINVKDNIGDQPSVTYIILKTYRFGGTEIPGGPYNLRDTIFRTGSFREPGTSNTTYSSSEAIERIFYVRGGNIVDITAEARPTVTRGTVPTAGSQRNIIYTLPARSGVDGWAGAQATRRVFVTELPEQDDNTTPPTITLTPTDDPLTIPAGITWNSDASWSLRAESDASRGPFKLGIDLGGFTPEWPTAGTYTITYVGADGFSGRYSTRTRTIIVTP